MKITPNQNTSVSGDIIPQKRLITGCCRILSITAVLYLLLTAASSANPQLFPVYPVIRNNVLFWEKIYSYYSINTAVIHDKTNPQIIYSAVSLLDSRHKYAKAYNQKKIKLVKNRYRRILIKLSQGKAGVKQLTRVKNLFPPNTAPQTFKKAADNIRDQRGLKENFIQGVVRSGAYITEIKSIFNIYGLPAELAYLPHVESSFNVNALSKYGASGIWQFTRETGKQYMQINQAVDERRDPIVAARAAARLLRDNYNRLHSWPLAITAYNYGLSGMLRAKNDQGSYEKIFSSYHEGYFKFASRNFYSEFLAAVKVAKKLEKSQKLKLAKPIKTRSFRLPDYASMPALCRYLRLSQEQIKKLNPALLPPVFTGKSYVPKNYLLHLPKSISLQTLQHIPASVYHSGQKASPYRVKKGDNLTSIARKYGVSINSLIRLNRLGKNTGIKAGQILKIPIKGKKKASRPKIIRDANYKVKKRPGKGGSNP
ncbi:MAG: lytic transglycosylase [Deltaproteobacteria bacterium]|nr:MAG: lytic transglycosylase [Deltaproteobacteria bacterium]